MPPPIMEPMSSLLEPPLTGDRHVDEALSKVAELSDLPVAEHVDVLKEAQRSLMELLNSGIHEA